MLSSSDDFKSVYTEPSFSEYLIRLHGVIGKGRMLKAGTKEYRLKSFLLYNRRCPFSLESFKWVTLVRNFEVN